MLVKHNKNSKGFIQIPILIAIIISVLIVGTGGYFGVRQYQSYQAKKIEKEKVAIEQKQKEDKETKAQEDAKAAEVEKLRHEVEELKKSQAKIENTKPPVTPEIKKTFSTAQIVSQNKKFIVNIICQTGDGSVYGSGVVIERSQNGLIILTNYHVTKYAKTPPAGVPPCIVVGSGAGLGESNEFYYGQPIYYPNVASQDTMS